jgi:WD40 repeat protein/tetratricopeptide (TPR) repeat protein
VESLDFRVEVGGGAAQGYEVLLRAPDGGEISNAVELPLPELEELAARVPDAVIASSLRLRRAVPEEEKPVRHLGGRLFDAVFSGRGRGMFTAGRHQAEREGRALRLVLQIRPPELARLPWEFLFDPDEDDYVGLSAALVRCPVTSSWARPLQVAGPLRVLGMTALPDNQQELAVAAEQQRLAETLDPLVRAGQVELEWVAGQSWRELQAGVRQGSWHVLHFIGHGGFDAATDEGKLALTAEDRGTYLLGAEDLAMMLRKHTSLRLVVLNACETGRASALDGFSSMAGALARRGVPAVLAMQQKITDRAALEFSRTFYEELASQPYVEQCVTQARQAIRLALPGTLEWGTPVLYMKTPGGILFDLADRRAGDAAGTADTAQKGQGADSATAAALEELYVEGLEALYTEQWDAAVHSFAAVVAANRGFKDSARKLNQARAEQRLASWYTAGHAAAEAGRWEEAIGHLAALVAAAPAYKDAAQLLERARKERVLAELRGEIAALHRAGKWAAVLVVGDRLAAQAPGDPDPDGLVESARAALEAERRTRGLVAARQRAVDHIDAGEWDQALQELTAIEEAEPSYLDVRELLERVHQERERIVMTQQERARKERDLAELRSEVDALHRAGNWAAVLVVGDRLAALAPGDPDAGGLVASARAALELERRARDLVAGRQRALDRIDAGEWDQALRELAVIEQIEPGYQDVRELIDRARHQQFRAVGISEHPVELVALTLKTYVEAVAFSPDGTRLAISGHSGLALVADLSRGTWRRIGSRSRPTHADVWDVAFDPAGRRVATASNHGAQVWDARTRAKRLSVSHGRGNPVRGVAFSPDGRLLVTAGYDGAAGVWDASAGHRLLNIVARPFTLLFGVAFSPDGCLVATACHDGTARVWDVSTGAQVLQVTHDKPVHGVAFSPTRRVFATASDDGSAGVWDLSTGAQLLRMTHPAPVKAVAFSPDGRLLATAGVGGTVLWDADTGAELLQVSRDRHQFGVAFSPDGRLLAVAGWSKALQLWQLREESSPAPEQEAITGAKSRPAPLSTTAIGRLAHARSRHPVRRYRLIAAAALCAVAVSLLVILPQELSGGGSSGATPPAHPSTGTPLGWQRSASRANPDYDMVDDVAFSPDGTMLAIASGEGTSTYLWNLASGKMTTLTDPGDPSKDNINGVAFSPNSKTLAVGDGNGTTYLWNLASGQITHTLTDPDSQSDGIIYQIAWSGNGAALAVVGLSNIYLWQMPSGQVTTVKMPAGALGGNSVALNSAGTTLAVGDFNGSTYLWNIASGQFTETLPYPGKFTESVDSVNVAFSPDGTTLAVGDDSGATYLWNLASRKIAATLMPRDLKAAVDSVAFSPDGKTLAVGESNGATYVWNLLTDKSTATLTDPVIPSPGIPITQTVSSVAFSPDGTTLAIGDYDGGFYLWKRNAHT